MKKIFTTLAIASALLVTAQVVPDASFGTSGFSLLGKQTDGYTAVSSVLQQDGKILIAGSYEDGSGTEKLFYARLNPDGNIDTSFGTNGFLLDLVIEEENSDYSPSVYVSQDRIYLVYGEHTVKVVALNMDGTRVTDFGTNGEINFSYERMNNYIIAGEFFYITSQNVVGAPITMRKIDLKTGEVVGNVSMEGFNQIYDIYAVNNKLVCVGKDEDTNKLKLDLYDSEGNLLKNMEVSKLDESLVRVSGDGNHIYVAYSNDSACEIMKYDNNGNVDASFGTGGALGMGENAIISIAILEGKIYIGGATLVNAEIGNLWLNRINVDGSKDLSFNKGEAYVYDGSKRWAESMLVPSANSILVVGEIEGEPLNEIYAGKFLITENLSTFEIKPNAITFANPVMQRLSFQSMDEITVVELLNVDGKVLRKITENHTNVSDLPRGLYLLKATLKNGQIVTKKMIKN